MPYICLGSVCVLSRVSLSPVCFVLKCHSVPVKMQPVGICPLSVSGCVPPGENTTEK